GRFEKASGHRERCALGEFAPIQPALDHPPDEIVPAEEKRRHYYHENQDLACALPAESQYQGERGEKGRESGDDEYFVQPARRHTRIRNVPAGAMVGVIPTAIGRLGIAV